jgi:hypothetical protein
MHTFRHKYMCNYRTATKMNTAKRVQERTGAELVGSAVVVVEESPVAVEGGGVTVGVEVVPLLVVELPPLEAWEVVTVPLVVVVTFPLIVAWEVVTFPPVDDAEEVVPFPLVVDWDVVLFPPVVDMEVVPFPPVVNCEVVVVVWEVVMSPPVVMVVREPVEEGRGVGEEPAMVHDCWTYSPWRATPFPICWAQGAKALGKKFESPEQLSESYRFDCKPVSSHPTVNEPSPSMTLHASEFKNAICTACYPFYCVN